MDMMTRSTSRPFAGPEVNVGRVSATPMSDGIGSPVS
jgi:hypothetical protein